MVGGMGMKMLEMLKGISGSYEVNRVVGALGTVAYIICANAFVAWDMLYRGHTFDVVAYCAAFPAGLGIAIASIAGAVALKDRNVATASVVRETGAQPTAAAAPAVDPNAAPAPVVVMNEPEAPVPTTTEETKA